MWNKDFFHIKHMSVGIITFKKLRYNIISCVKLELK